MLCARRLGHGKRSPNVDGCIIKLIIIILRQSRNFVGRTTVGGNDAAAVRFAVNKALRRASEPNASNRTRPPSQRAAGPSGDVCARRVDRVVHRCVKSDFKCRPVSTRHVTRDRSGHVDWGDRTSRLQLDCPDFPSSSRCPYVPSTA